METIDQNQRANSQSQELEKLIRDSGFDSLESWCIACITDIPNALYHAMYFHGQLKRYEQSNHAHVLKNAHDRRIPSELETEKISFLESLYNSRSRLLQNPPLSITALQELIDITKQESSLMSSPDKQRAAEKLSNLELMLKIQQCILASRVKLEEVIQVEIQELQDKWLDDNDEISEREMAEEIQKLESEKIKNQSKPKHFKKVSDQLDLLTAIYNKIKERNALQQIIGPKKSLSQAEIHLQIKDLEEKIKKGLEEQEIKNFNEIGEYLSSKQEEEKQAEAQKKPKKQQQCQETIKQLQQIISDEKLLQMLKIELKEIKLRNLKYLDIDEKTLAKVTSSISLLTRKELTMRQYEKMPQCLEYYLYKLSYLVQVYKAKAEDSIFKETNFETAIIDTIQKIQEQFTIEAFPKQYNEKKDQLMNLTQLRNAKGNLNLEEIQNTGQEFLNQIKMFDFEEFFHLLTLVDESAEKIKGKDIVLLLGSTGSGKSTTTHYLCGSLLQQLSVDHIQAQKIICEDLLNVKISNVSRSETRYITPIQIELDKIGFDTKQTVILVDSPGAEDTESSEVDIANMLGIIKAIHHTKSVRPIILVSFMKQGCRSEDMVSVFQFYSQMINDVKKNGDKFSFVFTKADDGFNLQGLKALLIDIQDKNCKKVGNQEFDSFIEHLVEKAENAVNQQGPQQVRILRPLDRDYIKFHEDIQNSVPIKEPSKVFQKTVLPKAYEKVDIQFRLNSDSTLQALKNKNDQLAFYKFYQLIKYVSIFPKNESYERKLKNLIQKITDYLNKTFQEGVEMFNNVFEKGNQLSNDILTQFFKAYNEFQNLDLFVMLCREKAADLIYLDQVKSIKEDWKTSSLFITNLVNISSFSYFIEKNEKNEKLEIDSPRWEEYISQLDLIIEYLQFSKDEQLKYNIQSIEKYIKEAENVFQQKMENLCNQTIGIIQSNIQLQSDEQDQDNQIEVTIKVMKEALEKIKISQECCYKNHFLTEIITKGIQLIENCLIESFNRILQTNLQELHELIKINKAQKEQNDIILQDNKICELQLITITKEQAKDVTSFLKIHGQVIQQLQFYLNPEYFQKIKMIGYQFSDDLFDIYNVNEKKLSDVASNKKSKILNIKKANQQIIILRKIPFIEQRTNISYNQIINKINQLFINQNQAIDEVMPELAQKLSNKDSRLNNTIYKLKDALEIIVELKEISEDFKSTYEEIAKNVKKNIDTHIDQIEDEISQTEYNFYEVDCIKKMEPLYKQIMQIGEVSFIIGHTINLNEEKVKRTHKAQLEIIEKFITPKVQQSEELKSSEQIQVKNKYLKRQDCEQLQMMYLYLKQFKDATYLLKYTKLGEKVQSLNLMLAQFIEKQIESMIQNVQENIQKITDQLKKARKINFQEGQIEDIQDQIGDEVQLIIYEIQDRLRTLKLIEKEKYYGIKQFLNINMQEEQVKKFVDEIFTQSFSLGQPKFDVKMIILRKLTILDSLLYPEEKKINNKYSLFDNTSISNPDEDLKKAIEQLNDSKYNQLRDTLVEQRDGIVISKIQYELKKKEKDIIELIRRVTSSMSEGFNESDLKDVNSSVEEILQIQQSIPQKYLAFKNQTALNIILEFYYQLIKVEENNRSQEVYMNEFENLEQYYIMKISRPKYLETVTIQQSRIIPICPDEKLFKDQYLKLQQALLKIEQYKKEFKQSFNSNRDPIQKILEEFQKTINDSFENFPKFRQFIEKLNQLLSQEKEIQSVDRKQAQKAKEQIYKLIEECYKSQYNRLKDDLDIGRLREKDFENRINQIKDSYYYVSEEIQLAQEQKFDEIFKIFDQKKKNSQEEFKKSLQENSNPLDIDFQGLPEIIQKQQFEIDFNMVDEKCQQALQSGLNRFKQDFCRVLIDHYPNLFSIKKIIHILSKEGKKTQELMKNMDDYIVTHFYINLQQISQIFQSQLQLELIKKEADDQSIGTLLKIVKRQLMCHLEFKISHEQISKIINKELDYQMINFMQFLIKIIKKITEKFEKLISDQNKMNDVSQLIHFVNSKKYLLECFNNPIFKKYVQIFLLKNDVATEFINQLEKLKVENMIKQLNEIHLQPAIISIKELVSKFVNTPIAQKCLDLIQIDQLSSIDNISELKEKKLFQSQVQELLKLDYLCQIQKIPELFEKAVLSQEELDLVQYKFKMIQNILSIKNLQKIEYLEQSEELKFSFSYLWLQKVQKVEEKAQNVMKCLDNIKNFKNEYQFILNLSNSIKINKTNPDEVPEERIKIQRKIDNCEQGILSNFKIFIDKKSNELQHIKYSQIQSVAHQIISLQQLCELFNYDGPLNDESKLLISSTLEKISKFGSQSVKDIQDELKKIGKYGELIITSGSIFQGMANEKINERLQKKSFQEILKGTSSIISKQQEEFKQIENVNNDYLYKYYLNFKQEYDQIVKEGIDKGYAEAEKKMADCKQKIQYLTKNESKIGFEQLDVFWQLLANIFSIWTLKESKAYFNADKNLDINRKKQLLKYPHYCQIIALFRIFCYQTYNNEPKMQQQQSEQRENQFKRFMSQKHFFNNIVEMQSSNGKSLVIAIASIIYALWGFEVYCCQKNDYLVNRNRAENEFMFTYLGVEKKIRYNTIKNLCLQYINEQQELSVQDCYMHRIVKQKENFIKQKIKQVGKYFFGEKEKEIETHYSRKSVLLIQDVQVLFDKQIHGKVFEPKLQINEDEVIELFEFISENIKEDFILKDGKLSIEKEGKKKKEEFTKCSEIFHKQYAPLLDEAIKKIIFDLRQLESVDYRIIDNKVLFKNHDFSNLFTPDESYQNGYLTVWAFYKAFKERKNDKAIFKDKIALLIKCGKFSYNEILNQFGLIVGVTSGLTTLNQIEQEYLQEQLTIQNFTVLPSIYEEKLMNQGIKIVEQKSHFSEIKYAIEDALNNTQPVIVVFQDDNQLNDFFNDIHQKWKVNKISADITNFEILQELIQKAGECDKITLISQKVAVGINFQSSIQNGIHVIQTFFSHREILDLQIRGLTARQGNRGSYEMILNQQDLDISFGYDEQKKKERENQHDYLKRLRLQRQQNRDEFDIKVIKNQKSSHLESMKNLQRIKLISDIDVVVMYLQTINEGANFNAEVHRTLILMEATEHMQGFNLSQQLYQSFPHMLQSLKLNNKDIIHQFKIGLYRNYRCKDDNQIYQTTHKWTEKEQDILESLRNIKFESRSIWQKAAIEVALSEALKQIKELKKLLPVKTIIIIGKNGYYYKEDFPKVSYYFQEKSRYRPMKMVDSFVHDLEEEKVPIYTFLFSEDKTVHENFFHLAKNGYMFALKDPKDLQPLIKEAIEGKIKN